MTTTTESCEMQQTLWNPHNRSFC